MKEHKKRKHGKMMQMMFLVVLFIFLLAGLLFLIKLYVLPLVLNRNAQLVNPVGSQPLSRQQVEDILRSEQVDATEVVLTDSNLSFVYNKKISVIATLKKDLKEQLDLVEAIDRQITLDGKQAISIDLRYNKPIVKF